MKKINILYIENGLGFGGAVTCLAALLRGLDKQKFNPIVVSSHNDCETKKIIEAAGAEFLYIKGYRRANTVNVFIHNIARFGFLVKAAVLTPLLVAEKILQVPFFIGVMRVAKTMDISIIHLNTGININLEGVLVSRVLKIPCVCHARGPAYNSFEARCISRYVTNFIPMSKFVEDSLLKLGVSKKKVNIIYDGIDIDECYKKSNMPQDTIYPFAKHNIGLFACLLPWKGQKVFIDSINILVKEKNVKDYRFFIVGDIPDKTSNYKQELLNMTKKLGLSDHIVFTGHQDNVYYLMSRMDIIVHTSIAPEPFGRVIIEAMSLGKPVIATNMGGPLEIIENTINGFLIPPNNPRILAQKTCDLPQDKQFLDDISKNAKESIKSNFSITNYIEGVEALYDGILQKAV